MKNIPIEARCKLIWFAFGAAGSAARCASRPVRPLDASTSSACRTCPTSSWRPLPSGDNYDKHGDNHNMDWTVTQSNHVVIEGTSPVVVRQLRGIVFFLLPGNRLGRPGHRLGRPGHWLGRPGHRIGRSGRLGRLGRLGRRLGSLG